MWIEADASDSLQLQLSIWQIDDTYEYIFPSPPPPGYKNPDSEPHLDWVTTSTELAVASGFGAGFSTPPVYIDSPIVFRPKRLEPGAKKSRYAIRVMATVKDAFGPDNQNEFTVRGGVSAQVVSINWIGPTGSSG